MQTPLDYSRLRVNPFDFQPDPAIASRYLERSAAELHEFFVPTLVDLDDFYRVWNSFAGHPDQLFRLIMGAKTWSRVTRLSDAALTVLFGFFFLEAASGYSASEFPDWLRRGNAIADGAIGIDRIGELYRAYQNETGAIRSVRELLQRNLDEAEKVELLQGFTFTRRFRLGEEQRPWNHLYCKREMCGSWCEPPAAAEVDDLCGRLVNRLYEMRSSVVHRNAYVLFASEFDNSEGIEAVPEMYDVFFLRDGRMMGYATQIEVGRLVNLFKAAVMRSCLSRATAVGGP